VTNQQPTAKFYVCPMHSAVRQAGPGQCPTCGMPLVPEGTRFGLVRHIFSNPMHLIMLAVMAALMIAAMMWMR